MSTHSLDHPPRLRPAAVLYAPDSSERSLPARFAEDLKRRGWRVGGLVQELVRGADGAILTMDAIEVDSGRRIPLARPVKGKRPSGECALDGSALTESTAVLRRAVAERVDLIVVEKFGEQEKKHQGLADEILAAMAEGIPTLIAVPAALIEEWSRFSGGLSDILQPNEAALWRWWGPHRLYDELARGVGNGPAKRVVVGFNWTLVEGPDGCGLAQTPQRDSPGCRTVVDSGDLAGRPLNDLARMIHSWDPAQASIGVAAVNAHYNRYDLEGIAENGLDVVGAFDPPVTVVGRFPGLAKRIPECRVIERPPRDGEFPATAADWLLPASEGVLVTASTLVDHSLPGLLGTCGPAAVAMVGPGTPLTTGLHAYGIDILSGLVVEVPDGIARAVAEGCTMRPLKRHARMVTVRR